jgi:hypothetical protein
MSEPEYERVVSPIPLTYQETGIFRNLWRAADRPKSPAARLALARQAQARVRSFRMQ